MLPARVLLLAFFCHSVVAGLIYSNIMEAPPVFDDFKIANSPALRINELSELGDILSAQGVPRKIGRASFGLNFFLGGENTFGYHLINVVIHVVNGVLLFLFAFRVLGSFERVQRSEASITYGSFLGALIWLAHPVQTQAVSYVYQRFTVLCALFFLTSLLCYVEARRRAAPGNYVFYLLFVLSGLLALGTKENAGILPLFILLLEFTLFHKKSLQNRRRMLLTSLIVLSGFLLICWAFLGTNFLSMMGDEYERRGFTVSERLLTECRVIVYYLSLLVLPHPSRLALDYDFPLSSSLLEPMATLFSLAVVLCLLGLAVCRMRRNELFSLALLWFFGGLAIESTVVPLDLVYEHRLYLPSMLPIVGFVAGLLFLAQDRRFSKAMAVFLLGILLLFSLWTYQRNSLWADPLLLWQDNAQKFPHKARVRNHLALAYWDKGEYELAKREFEKAIELKPSLVAPYINIALIHMDHYGELELAERILTRVLRLDNQLLLAHLNLGVVYLRQGRAEDARKKFEMVLAREPNDLVASYNLGLAYMRLGKHQRAIVHLQKVIKERPNRARLHVMLGLAYFELENWEKSEVAFRNAIRIKPNSPLAKNFLIRLKRSRNGGN